MVAGHHLAVLRLQARGHWFKPAQSREKAYLVQDADSVVAVDQHVPLMVHRSESIHDMADRRHDKGTVLDNHDVRLLGE